MSKAFVVRYQMRPELADENQRLVEQVFAELAADQPDGLRYASFRLDDGVTFVHVGLTDGDNDVLAHSRAFQEFQREFRQRVADGPVAGGARLVGSYGFGLDDE